MFVYYFFFFLYLSFFFVGRGGVGGGGRGGGGGLRLVLIMDWLFLYHSHGQLRAGCYAIGSSHYHLWVPFCWLPPRWPSG